MAELQERRNRCHVRGCGGSLQVLHAANKHHASYNGGRSGVPASCSTHSQHRESDPLSRTRVPKSYIRGTHVPPIALLPFSTRVAIQRTTRRRHVRVVLDGDDPGTLPRACTVKPQEPLHIHRSASRAIPSHRSIMAAIPPISLPSHLPDSCSTSNVS